MPKIQTTINLSELHGYAEDEGICSWNESCDILSGLYPEDGEGSVFIDAQAYERGDYEDEDEIAIKILVGFAKKHEAEYKTYSEGFKLVVE